MIRGMDKGVAISVVIPVYKVEQYIERCARSLFGQTLKKIEYIFVNDCTPDRSMDVLQKVINDYPERWTSIRIINHEQNMGQSSARNTGLYAATGKYIIYCDSDDWVEADMYECMYNEAEEKNADIVGCDFWEDYVEKSIYRKQNLDDTGEACIHKFLRGDLHCGVWNKLLRKDLYQQNKITWCDGVNMWEDKATICRLYFFAKEIAYVHRAFYHYVQYNPNSSIRTFNQKSCRDMISAVEILEDFFRSQNDFEKFDLDLNYARLDSKMVALLSSEGDLQKEWSYLWPQATPYILSNKRMHWDWRVALWFASRGDLFILNFWKSFKFCMKRILLKK